MNPFFGIDFSISDSLKTVRKSVLIYETIILVPYYVIKTTIIVSYYHSYVNEKIRKIQSDCPILYWHSKFLNSGVFNEFHP